MGVYVYRNDQVEGPFDELVLQQALMNGTMDNSELCCREGTENWTSASSFFTRVHLMPAAPAVSPFRKFVLPPTRAFWLRLSRGQVVALSIVGTLVGIFLLFSLLIAAVASSPSVVETAPQQTVEEQIASIQRQENEADQRYQSVIIQMASAAYAADQIQKSEQQGYYVPSDEKVKVLQQVMYSTAEGVRLGDLQKQLAAKKEALRKQSQQP